MNKQHLIRKCLLGGICMLTGWSMAAQETDSMLCCLHSTTAQETDSIVPGRAFYTTGISNTAAVATVKGVDLDKTISPNFTNIWAGQLTGLYINGSDGMPTGNADWLIRGFGSYSMARVSIAKLYVDGFEVDADYLKCLSPMEIESVSVLKDAASLSTFGMRGANGVIWIETKRGKSGKPTIYAQVRGTLQQPVNVNKALDAYSFASLYNQAVSNDNGQRWTPYYSQEQLAAYQNGKSPNIDWYKEVLKDQGSYLDANLMFNGGNESARYNIVLAYTDHGGLLNVDNSDENKDKVSNINMNKFNLRSNFDLNLFNFFEAKIDLGGRIENARYPNYNIDTLMNNVAHYPANIYFPYDNNEKTHYSGTTLHPNNPVGSLNGLGWKSARIRILQGNFTLKEKLDFITPGLYLKEAISFYSRTLSTYNKTRNYARY